MTPYDAKFKGLHILFDKENVVNTIGEYIAKQGLKQLRIAETEKYAHVTFFLNGGREEPFEGESRILVPSPKVATYDLQPEMSAPIVTERIVEQLNEKSVDFICLRNNNRYSLSITNKYITNMITRKFIYILNNTSSFRISSNTCFIHPESRGYRG